MLFTMLLGLVLVYVLSGTPFLGYDGDIMYRVSESLVLRHSFQIVDNYWQVNQPYSFYGLGTSLAFLPLVAAGELLHQGKLLIGLLEPIVTALSVLVLYQVLRALGVARRRSLVLALAYGLGTLAWHYAIVVFGEPLVGLGMLLALLTMLTYRRTGQARWVALSSAAVGLTVLTRWDSLLLIGLPLTVYAAVVVTRRASTLAAQANAAIAWALPLTAALAVNLGYDWLRYGNPFSLGYAETPGFSTPILTGLIGLLFSPGAGLFVYTPALLLIPLGYARFFRTWAAEGVLIAVLVVGRLLFFARWWDFDGHSWGPRFLVPLLPLLLIPIAFIHFGAILRAIATVLISAGVLIQVLGILVPYEGMAFGRVQEETLARLHLQQVYPGCVMCSYRSVTAVSRVIDFDWHAAPLITQSQMLLRGDIYPLWTRLTPALVALFGGSGLLLMVVARRRPRLWAPWLARADPPEEIERRIA